MRVQFPVTIFLKYMYIGADQTAGKRNNYFNLYCGFKSHHGNTKEDIRHCLILNVFKYFKDESLKFPPNHPQRSYLKKTAEVTGLHHRTISWICQSAKMSTASSSATQMPVPTTPALPASSNAAQVETAPSATRKYTPELYFR